MKNKKSLFLVMFFLVGCQTLFQTKNSGSQIPAKPKQSTDKASQQTQAPQQENKAEQVPLPTSTPSQVSEPTNSLPESQPTPPSVLVDRPRLAIILGPGGLRTFAHAGFIQELAKAKIPIFAIGGLETGALPAALFASRGQPFDPEWQMMKLKEEDWIQKGLLAGTSSKKPGDFLGSLNLMIGPIKTEDAKITFACPSYSSVKKQTFLMNKGSLAQVLLYCLPSEPLMSNYQGSGANPIALGVLAQNFRQKGAQLILYVDLIAENTLPLDENGMMWGVYQSAIQQDWTKANEVVKISGLSNFRNFSSRREMLQRGQEFGKKFIQTLQTKYGF